MLLLPINIIMQGRTYHQEENGPRPGRVPVGMGLGGRKYQGRSLGPGQGGSHDYFSKIGKYHSQQSIHSYHVDPILNSCIQQPSDLILVNFMCVCVSECYGEGITLGRNMGPGQGGSRSEKGLGGRKYLGRTLGPGQGGSQDYFAKKKEVPFRSENSILIKLR